IVDGVQTLITKANTPTLPDESMRKIRFTPSGDMLLGTGGGYILRCTADALALPRPLEFEVLLGPEVSAGQNIIDLLPLENGAIVASIKLLGLATYDGVSWNPSTDWSNPHAYRFGQRI